jgi:8-oxo-dGTP pyrophosphatase MutT (NUDIX family)
MQTRFEHSAGGVVVRAGGGGHDVALAARRTRRGELVWGLPKGGVEAHEQPEEAAIREVLEETGLVAKVRESLGDISYWYVWEGVRIRKRVSFYLMDAIGGDPADHDHEMEEVRWFTLSEATDLAGYSSEQDILRRAARALERAG